MRLVNSRPIDQRAVAAIKAKSELKELWQETEHFGAWSKSVVDLETRLAG